MLIENKNIKLEQNETNQKSHVNNQYTKFTFF